MHAFLIVGSDKTAVEQKIAETVSLHATEQNIMELSKIEHIKQITNFVSFGYSHKIAVIIYDIDKATLAAQNAFLKPLEEPQKNIIYILTATGVDNVIPTILSRVDVITLPHSANQNDLIDEIGKFFDATTGGKLAIVSKIKAREQAVSFLEASILYSKEKMAENSAWLQIVEAAEKARRSITANGNVTIHLTHFVVNTNNI